MPDWHGRSRAWLKIKNNPGSPAAIRIEDGAF
jgi:hypothetical protein